MRCPEVVQSMLVMLVMDTLNMPTLRPRCEAFAPEQAKVLRD